MHGAHARIVYPSNKPFAAGFPDPEKDRRQWHRAVMTTLLRNGNEEGSETEWDNMKGMKKGKRGEEAVEEAKRLSIWVAPYWCRAFPIRRPARMKDASDAGRRMGVGLAWESNSDAGWGAIGETNMQAARGCHGATCRSAGMETAADYNIHQCAIIDSHAWRNESQGIAGAMEDYKASESLAWPSADIDGIVIHKRGRPN
ncbi:hypothetical protein CC78DRAFT_570363 [Lojkania enalia]|uniref:Uncharacterized protein n=1 Tax=Lojkania enalia TaxID=147567 RepID=A0A9P4K5G3_9PLEO|nr:hypothetical protein CC78DRAFT_570363 [Didymosphaeria enalia]